jgi:hypothetical protein
MSLIVANEDKLFLESLHKWLAILLVLGLGGAGNSRVSGKYDSRRREI